MQQWISLKLIDIKDFSLSSVKYICGWALYQEKFCINPLTQRFYDEAIYKSVLIIKSLKVVKINFCKNIYISSKKMASLINN